MTDKRWAWWLLMTSLWMFLIRSIQELIVLELGRINDWSGTCILVKSATEHWCQLSCTLLNRVFICINIIIIIKIIDLNDLRISLLYFIYLGNSQFLLLLIPIIKRLVPKDFIAWRLIQERGCWRSPFVPQICRC